jgi:cytochrome oxidase Cu insertion factor (SCO1/SenC/PrrC family)
VLVSFDSGRDTPSALAPYHQRQRLPAGRWTLLHGQPNDVLELAALLGVKYKQDVRGQFGHANFITVLNAAGEVVHQQIGLNQRIDETLSAALRWLLDDGPTQAMHSTGGYFLPNTASPGTFSHFSRIAA